MKHLKRKKYVKPLMLICILLLICLLSSCGNKQDNETLSTTSDDMNTESASFIFEPQTEETLSTTQSSTQDSLNTNNADTLEDNNEDIEDTETTVPPRKNIALESASFIVTDNRGDTKLLGYNDCETFLYFAH